MLDNALQLWTVRKLLAENPELCISTLAELGVRHVESFDLSYLKQLKPYLDEYGIQAQSSHILWSHLTGRYDLAAQI